jgi:CHAD domain-containing protein
MASTADPPTPDVAARTLADVLGNIVASGRKPIETPGISDAVAVHDLRKALKNWRAMLRLVTPTVGDEAERMRIEARDLAREIAIARDSQAAQEALSDLGEELARLAPRARDTMAERLAALRASAETAGLTPDCKARLGAMWDRAANAIEQWPLARFDRVEATRQLAASYRRARKAIPQGWEEASPEALHRLRQRVVDHRYQLEIAEPLWPKIMHVWVSEAQRLRDRLGSHHDLVILRRLTEPHQPLARWRSPLAPLITERQATHVAKARRLAGRLFAEKPDAFFHRLAALWEYCARGAD